MSSRSSAQHAAPAAPTSRPGTSVQEASSRSPVSRSDAAASTIAIDPNARNVRVKVTYLWVDDQTRTAIYQQIPKSALRQVPGVNEPPRPQVLGAAAPPLSGSRRITSYNRFTRAILDADDARQVVAAVKQSPASELNEAPRVHLIEGHERGLSDLVQRPFVVALQPVGDDGKREPAVQMIEEGTRMRLLTYVDQDDQGRTGIHLSAEIVDHRIVRVDRDKILGFDEPITLDVPVIESVDVTVADWLMREQSLLVDMHTTDGRPVEKQDDPEDMLFELGNVMRRANKASEVKLETKQLLLLIEPSLIPSKRR